MRHHGLLPAGRQAVAVPARTQCRRTGARRWASRTRRVGSWDRKRLAAPRGAYSRNVPVRRARAAPTSPVGAWLTGTGPRPPRRRWRSTSPPHPTFSLGGEGGVRGTGNRLPYPRPSTARKRAVPPLYRPHRTGPSRKSRRSCDPPSRPIVPPGAGATAAPDVPRTLADDRRGEFLHRPTGPQDDAANSRPEGRGPVARPSRTCNSARGGQIPTGGQKVNVRSVVSAARIASRERQRPE